MHMSTKLAPGGAWARVENRETESHTLELAWWSETEAADNAAMVGGAQQAGKLIRKGEKE